MQEQEYEVSMVLSNTRDTSITLIVEPWGEIYEMVPHEKYILCFRSPLPPSSPQAVEIEYALDSFTVYAWDGCLFAFSHNGQIVSPGSAFVGPRVPAGVDILKKTGFFKQTMDAALAREKQKEDA
jgi:hypothetical protein